jgi:hypothetical protein
MCAYSTESVSYKRLGLNNTYNDTASDCRCCIESGALREINTLKDRFFLRTLLSTHQADERDEHVEPHGPPVDAEHPDTVNEEKFYHEGHHRFDNRNVEGGRKRRKETLYIAIVGDEPVIHVCAIEYCLYGFEQEHRIHCIRTCQKPRVTGTLEGLRAEKLNLPPIFGEIVTIHVFKV